MAIQSWTIEKVKDGNCLAILKPGLWQTFFRYSNEWYHFQHQLIVSKTIVKLFS